MDHSDAIKMRAVELYVLGDLSVSEVEEFERHFFDCPQCSEELRGLTLFQDRARAVFLEHGTKPREVAWWRGIWQRPWAMAPAFAALLLAVAVWYQAGALRSVQQVPAFAIKAARDDPKAGMVSVPSGAKFFI